MERKRLVAPVVYLTAGVVIGASGVYYILQKQHWREREVTNREYKAAIAELSARTLARLRTGEPDEAMFFLEDHLDSFMVGVPMGESYSQLTERCQHAMATAKVYRTRFKFPGGCKLHPDDLHSKHVDALLADVPLLAADDTWLDDAMRAVRRLPPAVNTGLQ